MKSEALRSIRTMRQVKTGMDVLRSQRPRTTNSLSKTSGEIEYLESLTDPRLEPVLEKERKRFAAQEGAINRSRQRMIKAREKLAATINKNRALMELRHELQQRRRAGEEPASQVSNSGEVKLPVGENSFNHVELRY
jgi:predicted  nucleic acid-binding Zn-ribbon protein